MKKNTYFVDLDGTIFKYRKFESYEITEAEVITPSKIFLDKIRKQGHMIIITTARPENLRNFTVNELSKNNIQYDILLMGIGRGIRYLINDLDPQKTYDRAFAINVKRDEGIS